MKKLWLAVILVMSLSLTACKKDEVEQGFDVLEYNILQHSLQERREAFVEMFWGEPVERGFINKTPFPNITFTGTFIYSFEDIFFITLAIYQHHPYLINSEERLTVYITPEDTFNLLLLPGKFSNVRRTLTEHGTHIVTGLHNGVKFEIEFEED